MKNFLISLFLFIGFSATAQVNVDSLNNIWLNETLPDTIRFKAMKTIAWDGYLFSKPDTAFILAQQLYDLAQKKENKKWQGSALNIQGISFGIQGETVKALDYWIRGLKIYEEIGNKTGIAASLINIGIIYMDQGETAKALDYYTRGLKIREEIGDKQGIAGALINIGSIYKSQGEMAKALDYYIRGLKIDEEIGDKSGIASDLNSIGIIYKSQGKMAKALDYCTRSLKIYEEIGYKGGIASSLNSIGEIYKTQGKLKEALAYSNKAMTIAQEVSSPELIKNAAITLKEIYKTKNAGMKAMEMFELEIQMRDSIKNDEVKKGLIQMEVEHEYEKKELLAEQEHQQEIFKKNETRNYLIAGVSLALLFSIGILSRLSFVRNTNKKLDIAKTRAEKSEQFKQQFLANMSHEIRTPMHAISGMVKILKRNEHPKTQDTYLNAMHSSSDNLLVILNDVLDLSKIEVGKLDIESISVKPAAIVENVMQILKFKAEEKGLILSANIEKDVPSLVMGDPTRLNQILINLIGNSIKFTEKGSVSVLLTKAADKLRFSIKDTGIGISKDRIDKIFGAFEQAKDSTSRNYGGTGLGLSITQQLTELQNGRIWVESKEGKGSTFFVELPIITAAANAIGEDQITEDHLKTMANTLSGTRILLVEDNAFNQMIAQEDLNYYIEDVKIDTVENGLLAIEKFQANDYDLILMDVQMPIMNGFEATQKIRELEKAAGKENTMPIIAMTASLLKSEVDNCLAAGMNNYIPKPYKPEELIVPIFTELIENKT